MYTLDQLRGFVAVAEEGNFGRAAERLSITQPPLSRQIQKLENDIGLQLLERTPRGAALTPAGRTFLSDARRLLSLAAAAPLVARRVATGTSGTVRIGFTAVAAFTVLRRWMQIAQVELPDVDLVLNEMVTRDQLDALLAGEIDVGLLRSVPRSGPLHAELAHQEPLVAAIPCDDPLAQEAGPLTLDQLAEKDIVTYSPLESSYFYELVAAAFRQARIRPRYRNHVSQVHTLLALVDAGLGIALVPHSATLMNMAGIVYRELPELVEQKVELYRVWRTDADLPPLTRLMNAVDERGDSSGPIS